MSPEGLFYQNYAATSEEFKKNFPESVFPPPPKEALAFRMERWYVHDLFYLLQKF